MIFQEAKEEVKDDELKEGKLKDDEQKEENINSSLFEDYIHSVF